MELVNNFKHVLLKWNDFQGRARRSEYWRFALVSFLISFTLTILDQVVFKGGATAAVGPADSFAAGFAAGSNIGPLRSIYSLLVLIPATAVSFRRLHDIGKTAWWMLLWIIPILGWGIMLYFLTKDSVADNKFGPNPKTIPA